MPERWKCTATSPKTSIWRRMCARSRNWSTGWVPWRALAKRRSRTSSGDGRRNSKTKRWAQSGSQKWRLRGGHRMRPVSRVRSWQRDSHLRFEEGQALLHAHEGQAKLNLPRPQGHGLGLPPAGDADIDIALLGPALDPLDQGGLAGTRWPGHHQLPELEFRRKKYPPDSLAGLDRRQCQAIDYPLHRPPPNPRLITQPRKTRSPMDLMRVLYH